MNKIQPLLILDLSKAWSPEARAAAAEARRKGGSSEVAGLHNLATALQSVAPFLHSSNAARLAGYQTIPIYVPAKVKAAANLRSGESIWYNKEKGDVVVITPKRRRADGTVVASWVRRDKSGNELGRGSDYESLNSHLQEAHPEIKPMVSRGLVRRGKRA